MSKGFKVLKSILKERYRISCSDSIIHRLNERYRNFLRTSLPTGKYNSSFDRADGMEEKTDEKGFLPHYFDRPMLFI
jgi:hypothetical protein